MKIDTINTLEFWEKVKEEYKSSAKIIYFLCEGTLFEKQWRTDAYKIKRLGKEFLKENVSDVFRIKHSHPVLFLVKDKVVFTDVLDTDKKQIRIDFINWNIERLKK